MKQKRINSFLTIADEEFAAAEKLQAPLPKQAQYFLQQTVEKLIRAILESEEVVAGMTHNLFMLAGMLPLEHTLRERFQEFEHLSSASTRYRYPSGGGGTHSITAAEVARILEDVRKLKLEVEAFLGRLDDPELKF